jgi:type I restriction enzyme, S subunit
MTDAQLPPGWASTTLGEVATRIRNGIFASRPTAGPDGVPILRISSVRPGALDLDDRRFVQDLEDGRAEDFFLAKGDLLFTRYNGSRHLVGICARVPEDPGPLLHPDKLIRVTVPDELADTRFLEYYMASAAVRDHLEPRIRTTAGQSGIAGPDVRTIPVLLPPRAEQERIVRILEQHLPLVDQTVRDLVVLGDRLERARRVVIRSACIGRLRPQGLSDGDAVSELRAALGEDLPAPTEDVPNVPTGWAWTMLSALAEVVGGVTKDSKRQDDPDFVEVPYLRVANVQEGALQLETVKTIRVSVKKAEQLRLRSGDVLLNEGGDRDKLGRGWIWEGQVPDCIHQNHVFRARVLRNVLNPKFLSWHGNTFGRAWFETNGNQTTNLASISLTNVKRLPIVVPPRFEQDQIVELIERHLTMLDAATKSVAALKLRCEGLRRVLIREAFLGRLVPQDPMDEPADLLMKRIAEDRAAAMPSARTRKPQTVTNARTTRRATTEETL